MQTNVQNTSISPDDRIINMTAMKLSDALSGVNVSEGVTRTEAIKIGRNGEVQREDTFIQARKVEYITSQTVDLEGVTLSENRVRQLREVLKDADVNPELAVKQIDGLATLINAGLKIAISKEERELKLQTKGFRDDRGYEHLYDGKIIQQKIQLTGSKNGDLKFKFNFLLNLGSEAYHAYVMGGEAERGRLTQESQRHINENTLGKYPPVELVSKEINKDSPVTDANLILAGVALAVSDKGLNRQIHNNGEVAGAVENGTGDSIDLRKNTFRLPAPNGTSSSNVTYVRGTDFIVREYNNKSYIIDPKLSKLLAKLNSQVESGGERIPKIATMKGEDLYTYLVVNYPPSITGLEKFATLMHARAFEGPKNRKLLYDILNVAAGDFSALDKGFLTMLDSDQRDLLVVAVSKCERYHPAKAMEGKVTEIISINDDATRKRSGDNAKGNPALKGLGGIGSPETIETAADRKWSFRRFLSLFQ